jgi:hypothetical protein
MLFEGRLMVSAQQKFSAALAFACFLSYPAGTFAQNYMTCGIAVAQLQQYVAQVNQVANYQYQAIQFNCGFNTFCSQAYLSQLNFWYAQQSSLVNGWYSQIVFECSGNRSPGELRSRRARRDDAPRIDERQIDELTVDDEDKTVRIRIPDSPRGFEPR